MLKRCELLCVFFVGGIIYTLTEMLWRGYSHPSMTAAGGVCFLIIHLMTRSLSRDKSAAEFFFGCVLGGLIITAVEFLAGVVVNILLGLDVWDYSEMPGNILGQICPAFTLAWMAISAPAQLLSRVIRRFFDLIGNGADNNEKQIEIQGQNAVR